MKKAILSAVLAAVLLVSGCSDASQLSISENVSVIDNNSSTASNNVMQTGNKEREQLFNDKCEQITKAFSDSIVNASDEVVQFNLSSIQYEVGNEYLSKLYTVKGGKNNNYRCAFGFIDIYTTDEYEYFQIVKEFISFVNENALELSGSNQFVIDVNAKEGGTCDIGIVYENDYSSITYANRNVRSAYSERLKSIEILKDSREELTTFGLVNYEDVSNLYEPYEVSCYYQGKTLSHKWYKIDEDENNPVFVTYIDDGTYDDMSDDELVFYAYSASTSPSHNIKSSSDVTAYFAYKSKSDIACSFHLNSSPILREYSYCSWNGDYERLNSNAYNKQCELVLKGNTD